MRCWCAGRDAGWQGVHGRRRSSRPSSRPCRVRRGCRTRVQDESQTDQRPRHRSATHPYWCVGRNCWPLLTLGCLSDETKHTVYCMGAGHDGPRPGQRFIKTRYSLSTFARCRCWIESTHFIAVNLFFAQFVSKSTGPSCEPSHCLAIDVGLPDPFLVTELRTTDLQSYRPRRPKTVHHRLNLN